ncbi:MULTISPECIES: GAF domain-containing protein [Gulbenkiania]|nr:MULTISPECIES: GAF domain-containing protein [Gulbenkiania]
MMIPVSHLTDYLREQGLKLDLADVQVAALTLKAVLDADKPDPSANLFRYPVPRLSDDGACSLVDELAPEPFDLAPLFGGETLEARTLLASLNALVHSTQHQIGADWLGIYVRAGEGETKRLVKLAYQGLPSRAEFPLTEAFAEGSNNSRVGLTGWGVLIDDVAVWRAEGGGYYECDPKVRSEVCLPVVDAAGRVLGIIDAESATPAFFTPEKQAWLTALAVVLAHPFGTLPWLTLDDEDEAGV